MCNLCRKVATIKGIDSVLLKPVILIISKLHERIEPNLGDALLRREGRIHAIRSRLLVIQKRPLKGLIGMMIADLDSELRKIEVSKEDHPAAWSVGKLNFLKVSIKPDESSSVRMRNRDQEARVANRGAAPEETFQKELEQDHSMFDLHPHPEIIEYSTQLVDEWFTKIGEVLLSEGASEYRDGPYRDLTELEKRRRSRHRRTENL